MGLWEHFPYANFHGLNLDWVLVSVKDLNDRVEALEKRIEEIKQEILAEVDEKLQAFKEELLREVQEKLDALKEELEAIVDQKIDAAVAELETKISEVDTKVVKLREEFEACCEEMRNRLSEIENRLSNIETRIDGIAVQISGILTRLDTLETEIGTIDDAIADLVSIVNTAVANITTLQQEVTTIKNNISTINQNITTLTNKVNSHTTQINDHEDRITALEGAGGGTTGGDPIYKATINNVTELNKALADLRANYYSGVVLNLAATGIANVGSPINDTDLCKDRNSTLMNIMQISISGTFRQAGLDNYFAHRNRNINSSMFYYMVVIIEGGAFNGCEFKSCRFMVKSSTTDAYVIGCKFTNCTIDLVPASIAYDTQILFENCVFEDCSVVSTSFKRIIKFVNCMFIGSENKYSAGASAGMLIRNAWVIGGTFQYAMIDNCYIWDGNFATKNSVKGGGAINLISRYESLNKLGFTGQLYICNYTQEV